MSELKAHVLAKWVSDDLADSNFVPLRMVLERALGEHIPDWSEERVADVAEKLEAEALGELRTIAEGLRQLGTEPPFVVAGEPGAIYIRAENMSARQVLASIKSLTGREFEDFCAALLEALGAASKVVGGSGDGGIDFTAYDLPVAKVETLAVRGSYPFVVGQAKRYLDGNLVSVNALRDFLGGAVVRADTIRREFERFGLFSPAVFAFWTTSSFTAAGRRFAVEAGIWALDGLPLAQLAIRLGLPIAVQHEALVPSTK
jgi:hypothetical protein